MEDPKYLSYDHAVDEICEELEKRYADLQKRGVAKWMIIVDPGIGFSKVK